MASVERLGAATNRFPIQLSNDEEQLEAEPNDAADAAAPFTVPAVLNGRIDCPGDVDIWRFTGKKGDICSVDLQAERIGSLMDSVLVVCDAEGHELARNDDIDGKQSDSTLQWTVPNDGTYLLKVSERFGSRGGLRFAYRLAVTLAAAQDFTLSLPVDALTVNRGAEVKLKIAVNRNGGFTGEIALKVENLTPGVTVTGDKIEANKNEAELTFKADVTAKIGPVSLQITGSAQVSDQLVSHTATKLALTPDDMEIDRLLLVIAIPTPFSFAGAFQTNYAARGSTFEKHFTIDRGGFPGPIEVSLADRQNRHLQGVSGMVIIVPAGESEFTYPIHLPSWMEIGRTSRTCLMATGLVDEPDGSQHKVSFSSEQQNDQIIVLVDPGQLEVRAQPKSIVAIAGGSAQVRIEIGRGAGLDHPVIAELRMPAHIQGVTASPMTIQSGQAFGILEIQFAQGPSGPFNMPLRIVATASPNGKPYTAETTIEIVPQQPVVAMP